MVSTDSRYTKEQIEKMRLEYRSDNCAPATAYALGVHDGYDLDRVQMTFDEYQHLADRTQNYSLTKEQILACSGLGLSGEAGECSDLLKKHLFHGHPMDREKVIKELGDVLWYVAAVAQVMEIPLHEVAEANIAKLKARYPDGFTVAASINRKA